MRVGDLSELGEIFTLLPGLVTYLVVRTCTGRERKIDVPEAILHGLAYTLLAHAVWAVCITPGSLIPTPEIVGLPLCAIGIGIVVAFALNHRIVFRSLRWLGLSREPEFPSIWETSFKLSELAVGDYVVVELDDERRIQGGICGVSPEQKDGHICLDKPRWLPSDGQDPIEISGWFLVPGDRIRSVHFLPKIGGTNDEQTK